jgi:hypothetical protein
MSERSAEDMTLLRSLVSQLKHSPRVRRVVVGDDTTRIEEIATEAADSLVDIRRSAAVLSSELLPKLLTQQPESEEFDDTLDDIAEELRHIYYHITNTKLFDYIVSSH